MKKPLKNQLKNLQQNEQRSIVVCVKKHLLEKITYLVILRINIDSYLTFALLDSNNYHSFIDELALVRNSFDFSDQLHIFFSWPQAQLKNL